MEPKPGSATVVAGADLDHRPFRCLPPVVAIDLDHEHVSRVVMEILRNRLHQWDVLDSLEDSVYKLTRQNAYLLFVTSDLADTFTFHGTPSDDPLEKALQVRSLENIFNIDANIGTSHRKGYGHGSISAFPPDLRKTAFPSVSLAACMILGINSSQDLVIFITCESSETPQAPSLPIPIASPSPGPANFIPG
jgi:hypothetical protein